MSQQAAYNPREPNTHGPTGLGDRVMYVFRLYRKLSVLPAPAKATSLLAPVLQPINNAISSARNAMEGVLGALTGVVLEREYQFPLVLERFQESSELRTHFQYIRDGYFIDTPFQNARGVSRFRIGGRTYNQPVSINGVPVDGDAALKDFKELIDDLFYPADGSNPSDYKLYWYNYNAPVSADDPFGEFEWLIWPDREGVRVNQSAGRPLARFFEFSFLGLQSNRDRAKADDGFLSALLSSSFLKGLIDNLGLTAVASALQDVFGTLKNVQGLLNDVNSLALVATDYIRGVTLWITSSIATVRNLLASVQSTIGTIETGIGLVKNLPNLTSGQLQQLWSQFPGLASSGSAVPGIIACDELRRVQDLLLALNMQPQNFLPTVNSSPASTKRMVVGPGQTIEQIAAAHNVDVDTLISLNGLQYPFIENRPNPSTQLAALRPKTGVPAPADPTITSNAGALQNAQNDLAVANTALLAAQQTDASPPDIASLQHIVDALTTRVATLTAAIATYAAAAPTSPGVLYVGDAIKIPNTSGTATPAPPSILQISPDLATTIVSYFGVNQPVTEEDRLLGLDLYLDQDGNLEWDETRQELVFDRALAHMQNVQTYYVRLPLGQLRYAPGIGNFGKADLGKWQSPTTNRLLAYAWQLTLQQDPRIQSIRRLAATTYDGVAYTLYDAVLINKKTVPDLRTPIV